jgi:transcriptional regulator with XRE-family HTH domain
MINNSDKIDYFRLAFDYVLTQRGSGAQNEIAIEIDKTESFISQLRKGKKNASSPVQQQIAAAYGYDYADFIMLGKNIASGIDTSPSPNIINEPMPHYGTDKKTKDIIKNVIKIMQSGNAGIINALVKNVHEFSLAVDTASELKSCLDNIEALQKQIDILNEKVDRLSAHPDGTVRSGDSSE